MYAFIISTPWKYFSSSEKRMTGVVMMWPVIIINACDLVFRRLAQCGHTKPKLSQTLKKIKIRKEAERVAKAISNVLKSVQKQVSGHGGHALQGDFFFLLLADHHKVKGFVPSCMSVMMCHHKPIETEPIYHGSKLPKVWIKIIFSVHKEFTSSIRYSEESLTIKNRFSNNNTFLHYKKASWKS